MKPLCCSINQLTHPVNMVLVRKLSHPRALSNTTPDVLKVIPFAFIQELSNIKKTSPKPLILPTEEAPH
jgi:hypothetical protein